MKDTNSLRVHPPHLPFVLMFLLTAMGLFFGYTWYRDRVGAPSLPPDATLLPVVRASADLDPFAKEKSSPSGKDSARDALSFSTTAEWDPTFFAYTKKEPQFFLKNWREVITLPPPPANTSERTQKELELLAHYRDTLRTPERVKNILDEVEMGTTKFGEYRVADYFDPKKFPATAAALNTVWDDFNILILLEKERYNRVRPSVLDSSLAPVIAVPGHPAYPSGHSSGAHFLAYFLGELVPEKAKDFEARADEIAIDREIAGFHYPSDTKAGQILAKQFINELFKNPEFVELFQKARQEWRKRAVFTCKKNDQDTPKGENKLNFGGELSCYTEYYRNLTDSFGAMNALAHLKTKTSSDPYAREKCHEITHVIGRTAGETPRETAGGVAEVFAAGDALCSGGYYHGVMEGALLKEKTDTAINLAPEFLNGLCAPFRDLRKTPAIALLDCSHGLGHGIMEVKGGEIFQSLATCDTLSHIVERRSCWTGVFMENVIQDFKGNIPKYLKPEEPMYPCSAVQDRYRDACYAFQTSYVLKQKGNFSETFAACRTVPTKYQNTCLGSIGRDAAGMADGEIAETKENCSFGGNVYEKEQCALGAARALVNHHHSDTQTLAFCNSLEEKSIQKVCTESIEEYYRVVF